MTQSVGNSCVLKRIVCTLLRCGIYYNQDEQRKGDSKCTN
jgi:hypothetical protein